MSTKIYNGYRMPAMSAAALMGRLVPFGDHVRAIANDSVAKTVARYAVESIDNIAAGQPHDLGEHAGRAFYWSAWQHVQGRHREVYKSGRRDPECDFGFSLCVIPTPAATLAIAYTERAELLKELASVRDIKPWPYWNNSDPDKGVSERSWRKRGKAWDAALGNGIPSRVGLNFDPIGELDWPRLPRVTDFARRIRFDRRVGRVATDIVRHRWCKPRAEAVKGEVGGWMDIISDFSDWLNSDEGKAALAAESERLGAILKPRLTQDDLRANVPVAPREGQVTT